LRSPRQQEWEINQGINDEVISEAISCGPDGIPMEFFKVLIPR